MEPEKIPRMTKTEYDALIERQCVSRISFGACEHPYIAPFMYVFDKKYLYFLSTKYGRKMEYFAKNPKVSVEIEENDTAEKKKIRQQFVEMMARKKLSHRVLTALGHRPDDRPDVLVNEERSLVWKLVGVKDIVALKNG